MRACFETLQGKTKQSRKVELKTIEKYLKKIILPKCFLHLSWFGFEKKTSLDENISRSKTIEC